MIRKEKVGGGGGRKGNKKKKKLNFRWVYRTLIDFTATNI